jgi:hypothetical protein
MGGGDGAGDGAGGSGEAMGGGDGTHSPTQLWTTQHASLKVPSWRNMHHAGASLE